MVAPFCAALAGGVAIDGNLARLIAGGGRKTSAHLARLWPSKQDHTGQQVARRVASGGGGDADGKRPAESASWRCFCGVHRPVHGYYVSRIKANSVCGQQTSSADFSPIYPFKLRQSNGWLALNNKNKEQTHEKSSDKQIYRYTTINHSNVCDRLPAAQRLTHLCLPSTRWRLYFNSISCSALARRPDIGSR